MHLITNNPRDVLLIGKRLDEKTASSSVTLSSGKTVVLSTVMNAKITAILPKKEKKDLQREEVTASKEGEEELEKLQKNREMLKIAGKGWLTVNFSCCKMIALDYLDRILIPKAQRSEFSTMSPLETKFYGRFLEEYKTLEEVPYTKKVTKEVTKSLVIQREQVHRFINAKRSLQR